MKPGRVYGYFHNECLPADPVANTPALLKAAYVPKPLSEIDLQDKA